jgi:hypothetical protein
MTLRRLRLRSGITGYRVGWGGHRVPAGAGLGKEAEAGPFGELSEHVPGLNAEPACELPAGPVLSGLAGHDARDLVSSGGGAGLAGAGRGRLVLPAAGAGGGGPAAEPRS